MRVRAILRVRVLRRFLRRFGSCLVEVGFRYPQVVLGRHGLAVTDPLANDVDWVAVSEFGLTRRPQVVP